MWNSQKGTKGGGHAGLPLQEKGTSNMKGRRGAKCKEKRVTSKELGRGSAVRDRKFANGLKIGEGAYQNGGRQTEEKTKGRDGK